MIQIFPKDSPLTVNNYVFLAREGFYNGVKFHRVVHRFVIQTGDPTGTGHGGPGYQLPMSYRLNAPANRVLSLFGQVIGGMDIMLKIDNIPMTGPESSSPTVDVHINIVTIQEK